MLIIGFNKKVARAQGLAAFIKANKGLLPEAELTSRFYGMFPDKKPVKKEEKETKSSE